MTSHYKHRLLSAATATFGLMVAGICIAQVPAQQQPKQPNPPSQPRQLQSRQGESQTPIQQRVNRPITPANMTDAQLAGWLLVDNQGEVALGQIAAQRAQSEDVKKFAAKMVEDHSKFIERLQPFASQQVKAVTNQNSAPGQAAARSANPGSLDIVEIKQRLGQKCLETTRLEFEKKEGAEFDRCYAGKQVMAHMMMLDTLEVFRDLASAELRPVLEEGIKTTEEHLKHAKEMAEQKMEHRGTEQARRDVDNNRN